MSDTRDKSVLEAAKAHYQALAGKPKRISVPEWGGEAGQEIVIYATPLTLSDRMKIEKLSGGSSAQMAAYTLIIKAKDKNGKSLFTLEDKTELMRYTDASVISRIALGIMADSGKDIVEEAEKNF